MGKKPSKTKQKEALEELTPKQSLALDGLLAGDRFQAAGDRAGVSRNTVARWLKEDPVFIASFKNRRSDIESSLDLQIRDLAGEALQVLREEMESNEPRVRIAAAREILRQRQQAPPVDLQHCSATEVAMDIQGKIDNEKLWGTPRDVALSFFGEQRGADVMKDLLEGLREGGG